jgi:peroxiredoxin
MTRAKAVLAGAVAAVLIAPVLWWSWPSRQAPDVAFNLIDGRQLQTRQLRGKPLLISFWATSCPSCLQEIPDLVALQQEYGRHGLTIIGVAMPYDPPNLVVDFARQRQLPYAIALDLDAQLVHAFGNIQVTPTNILVGPQGRILEQRVGKLDLQRTRRRIAQLLEES